MRRALIVEAIPFGIFKKSNVFQVSYSLLQICCTSSQSHFTICTLNCARCTELLNCARCTAELLNCARCTEFLLLLQVGDNVEVLYMVATSEFERESWIKALRQCESARH